ncbi:DUF6580 family putative transport protein [Marinicella sp. W31]|uniref:DUF6580 family putative transport protein n=1 Tax=Marinicella sp. W31 TaxID=3023713 RepID=UPI0037570812
MKKIELQLAFLIAIIFLAAFSRLYSQVYNFSPLAAIGLFGAAHFFRKWQAFLIPIAATWVSDLYVNNVVYAQYNPEFVWFYQGFYWQYGSYLLITVLGLWLFRKRITVGNVLLGAVASGLLFFLVSNFGVWLTSGLYPLSWSGLQACYVAAIPFYKGTALGDLFFAAALFGGYYLLQRQFSALRMSHLRYGTAE